MLLVGAVVLIAAYATILRYVVRHAVVSAAVVSGVIILVVIKHPGARHVPAASSTLKILCRESSNALLPLQDFAHLIQSEVQFQRSGATNRNFDSSPDGHGGRDSCSDRALRAHV